MEASDKAAQRIQAGSQPELPRPAGARTANRLVTPGKTGTCASCGDNSHAAVHRVRPMKRRPLELHQPDHVPLLSAVSPRANGAPCLRRSHVVGDAPRNNRPCGGSERQRLSAAATAAHLCQVNPPEEKPNDALAACNWYHICVLHGYIWQQCNASLCHTFGLHRCRVDERSVGMGVGTHVRRHGVPMWLTMLCPVRCSSHSMSRSEVKCSTLPKPRAQRMRSDRRMGS